MSKEKMALCIISGPVGSFGSAVEDFIIGRPFKPENAITFIQDIALLPLELESSNDEALRLLEKLAAELGIKPVYEHIDTMGMEIQDTEEYLNGLFSEISALNDERQRLAEAVQINLRLIDILQHINTVDVAIEKLLAMKSAKLRFGRMPASIYANCSLQIENREDCFYITTSVEEDYVYGIYFVLPSAEEKVDAFFAALKFERIWISEKVQGSPEQSIASIREENHELRKQISSLEVQKDMLRQNEQSRLLRHYSFLKMVSETCSYIPYAGQKEDKFYLVGFVPLSSAESYSKTAGRYGNISCSIIKPQKLPGESNKAEHNKFIKLLETEKKTKELYDYALDREHRLTDDISQTCEALRQTKYKEADIYLEKARFEAESESNYKIEELGKELQAGLGKIRNQYLERKDEWSNMIFSAVINN